MNRPRHFAFLCALLLAATVPIHAAETTPGKIVFSRLAFDPTGPLDYINLNRINTDGTGFRQLTPSILYRYRWTPTWSPHGTWIAFSQFTTPTNFRYDIHIVNNAGDRDRQLTIGTGSYQFPSWSPKGTWIAFKSTELSGKTCVSVVRPDGTAQHALFCPPTSVVQSIAPVWSHDGNCVFIAADYLDENGFHRIIAYQVHLTTGEPVVLGDIGVPSADTLVYFSPGGARTLLGSPNTDGVSVVNFATGLGRGLSSGHAPVWSPDGRHVAYSLTTLSQDGFEIDDAFVINFDGTNEHALTTTPTSTPNIFYTPADWSPDSRKVLVNRTIYDDNGFPVTRMYIIDATTLARTKLASGTAAPGAWFKPFD